MANRAYSKVTVFCLDACRNNIGSWETRKIHADSSRKDFAYYAAKDVAMAHQAKCGVMLCDGRSKGTLHNILNLIGAGRKVLVCFAPEKAFYKLASLLARCDRREIEHLQISLATLNPHAPAQLPLRPRQ